MNAHQRRVAKRDAFRVRAHASAIVEAHARAECVRLGLDPDKWALMTIDYRKVFDEMCLRYAAPRRHR